MERFRDTPQETRPTEQPAKKRFAIHKLEERIAPAKGGIPGKPVCNYGYSDCCHGPHCQLI